LPAVDEQRIVRLALVDDEALFRDLLHRAFDASPGLEVLGAFGSPDEALQQIPALDPDVVVLDIDLGADMTGVELGIRLRRQSPGVGIVLLSNHADPQLLSSLPEDVSDGWSYLLKRSITNIGSLTRAIEGAADGLLVFDPALTRQTRPRPNGPIDQLSARQREILALMAEGFSNRAIAEQIFLSERSVENHISRLYVALGFDGADRSAHARVRAVLAYLAGSITVSE
jgi:DNA-binding NarL/FixJ family response regulator